MTYSHESEQIQGDREGQGSLLFYSPWSCKELDLVTEEQDLFPVFISTPSQIFNFSI